MPTYTLGQYDEGYTLGAYGEPTPAPVISAADDAVEDQSATVTLANNEAAPTELRLGGTVVSFTFDAGVMTYTAPLLPRNPELTLEVDVDSVTLSTVIAYTNTYPYTHTPGEVDPDSIIPESSFGTTQLVELKVVTDADSEVLIVTWAAYDADNFESAVSDFVTAVSEVAASTDVVIGYHITETGDSGTFTRTLSVEDVPVDETPPVITILGDNPLTITEGDTFTDPGATALDDVDGDITGSIVVTGSVDANTPGEYVLTYSATDEAGNTGTATRTVIVEAAAVALPPQGTITFGTATITGDSISQPWSYNLDDADSFQMRVDGGTIETATNPISVTGLEFSQQVQFEVRAVNEEGESIWFERFRTTSADSSIDPPDGVKYGPGYVQFRPHISQKTTGNYWHAGNHPKTQSRVRMKRQDQ